MPEPAETPAAPKPNPPEITSVSFGMTVNLGNYENAKFELVAKVPPGEDWRIVLEGLRRRCLKLEERVKAERDATQ